MSNSLGVIPTYVRTESELEVVKTTVRTLREQEPDLELLLVDDGSPSRESVELLDSWIREVFPDVFFLRKDENEGFSRTVNHGLRIAQQQGKNAILINADIEFTRPFVEKMEEDKDSQDRPAAVVGALLLYPNGLIQHAGVFFCQPPGSIIRTATGDVPIEDLDADAHGLQTYCRQGLGYGRIFRGATSAGRWSVENQPSNGGYPFVVGSRPYSGDLVVVTTRRGDRVRVTPNHKMTAFWTERGLSSYVVYIARRGNSWRVGHVAVRHGSAFGPRMRMVAEDADCAWILSAHDTKFEAIKAEALVSWKYSVPTWSFLVKNKPVKGCVDQFELDSFWSEVDCKPGALAALKDYGRSLEYPLCVRPTSKRSSSLVGPSRRNTVFASNLLPGLMRVPVDNDVAEPGVVDFVVDQDEYEGLVYSMDVTPHEHYISDGVVVHNSFHSRAFDHRYRYGPGGLPEAYRPLICPVTGALQFIRHSTLETVGLYDETFRMGFEDVDYCLRVFDADLECVYDPRVMAIHHESLFRGQRTETLDEWQQKSLEYLHQKHAHTSLGRFVPPIA